MIKRIDQRLEKMERDDDRIRKLTLEKENSEKKLVTLEHKLKSIKSMRKDSSKPYKVYNAQPTVGKQKQQAIIQ